MSKERIGFIGTGIMGEPMVRNLLRAGYPVAVHSRTKARAQALLEEGVRWADAPRDVAQAGDIVITCVTDTPDVQAVLLGPGGVIEAAREGLICIDMSTISPAETRKMGETLAKRGVTLLDAPISGGQIGAIEAKLSIMIGGPGETVEKVRPIMETLGRTITHCGPLGCGQTTKLANQVMVVHTILSVAEGLAFAERAGLDLETTLKVTTAGAAGSRALTFFGPMIAAGDFQPGFTVDLQQKDLRLVLEYAEQIGQPLPGVALIKQLFAVLQAQGRGSDGVQSLIDVLRHLAGPKP